MDKLLFRPSEAAEAIGIGRSKVYELIASGELPSIRIGSSVRVSVAALEAWVERRLAERNEEHVAAGGPTVVIDNIREVLRDDGRAG